MGKEDLGVQTMDSNVKHSLEGRKVWTRPNVQRLNAKEARNENSICPNDGQRCGGGSGDPTNKSDGGTPS